MCIRDRSEAGERIVSGKPAELAEMEFDDLAVVVVENENYVNQYKTLKDSDFVRGKSPMTKELSLIHISNTVYTIWSKERQFTSSGDSSIYVTESIPMQMKNLSLIHI